MGMKKKYDDFEDENKPPPPPIVKRNCLKCDRRFDAKGRHQRLCKHCRIVEPLETYGAPGHATYG